jgi:hypothetical protein
MGLYTMHVSSDNLARDCQDEVTKSLSRASWVRFVISVPAPNTYPGTLTIGTAEPASPFSVAAFATECLDRHRSLR